MCEKCVEKQGKMCCIYFQLKLFTVCNDVQTSPFQKISGCRHKGTILSPAAASAFYYSSTSSIFLTSLSLTVMNNVRWLV